MSAESADTTKAIAAEFAASAMAGRVLRVDHLSVLQHLTVLHELIATQPIAMCKSYAALPEIPSGRFESLDTLRTLILRAPESVPGDAGDFPFRVLEDNYIAFTGRKSSKILFVFTGAAHQFGGPIRILHQWFRCLDASIVYLFDMDWTYYLGGIKGLSESVPGTVQALQSMAQRAGAASSFCIGNSGGGFGALLYGPLLGSRRVLAFSPPTVIRESLEIVTRKVPHLRQMASATGSLDLRTLYQRPPSMPDCRIHYPEENMHDREEALNLKGITGLDLRPVAGVKKHNLIQYFVANGRLGSEVRWLVDGH